VPPFCFLAVTWYIMTPTSKLPLHIDELVNHQCLSEGAAWQPYQVPPPLLGEEARLTFRQTCNMSVCIFSLVSTLTTVITLCFWTPFLFGHPLYFIEKKNFLVAQNMFFGHPKFSDTPIFHRNNYFLASKNIG